MNEMRAPEVQERLGAEETGSGGGDPREEALYDMIVAAVLSRQLRAGERLNEQLLSEAHGISRTRVRRVLVRLQHAGIVRFERNRGAFIHRPTVREAHDLFDVRRYLEECAVHAAVRRAREGQEQDWSEDAAGYEDVSVLIARASDNQVLVRLIADLLRQCALIQAVYGTQEPKERVDRHELLARIRGGDAAGAIVLLHRRMDALLDALDLAGTEQVPDVYGRRR